MQLRRRFPLGGRIVEFVNRMNRRILAACVAALVLSTSAAGFADDEPAGEESTTPELTEKWTVLWDSRRAPEQPGLLDGDAAVSTVDDLQLTGIPTADRFQLKAVDTTDGAWGTKNRWLVRVKGKDSAVRLARGEAFELEGMVQAETAGGWFLLLGWDKGHGYGVYNVTLKTSGSIWFLSEFRDSTALEETHREISRFLWKGMQPLNVQVVDKKLTFTVGKTQVVKEVELPNYSEGDIILGTYDTPYGPKPVGVRSLRVRAK